MAADKFADFRVVIIGAGTVGLLLSQGLKKRGIKSVIYEREAFLHERSRDWNFGIYWAHNSISRCLPDAINEKLSSAQTNPFEAPSDKSTLPLLNNGTGEHVMSFPTPFVYRLNRSKMRSLLSDGLDIEFGKRLTNISEAAEAVTAHFEDGSSASGSLLIGADGAKSRVRDFLLGEKAALDILPLMTMSALVTLPAETSQRIWDEYSHISMLGYSQKGIVTFLALHDVPDLQKPETYQWILYITWNDSDNPSDTADADKIRTQWMQWSTDFAEPFKSIYTSLPQGTKIWCDRLSQWPTIPWDNRAGRVTLAGDAAHPMTFHRGQGLNTAVEDAAEFCDILADHLGQGDQTLAEAVASYEKDMIPRGNKAVIESGQNSMMVHNWEQLMNSDMMKYGLRKRTE